MLADAMHNLIARERLSAAHATAHGAAMALNGDNAQVRSLSRELAEEATPLVYTPLVEPESQPESHGTE